jgi:acyl-CoA dehydrogenase
VDCKSRRLANELSLASFMKSPGSAHLPDGDFRHRPGTGNRKLETGNRKPETGNRKPETGNRKLAMIRPMPFDQSERSRELATRLTTFMNEHVYPNERVHRQQLDDGDRWQPVPIVESLKAKARAAGLWNLFLPESEYGAGLSNAEYAPLCEIMGRSPAFAPEIFNCSAPDTGNMEVLVRYGAPEQRRQWLAPLLDGTIRSCFAMTEPAVASSDATNIESSIVSDGDDYVINGRKWWISGAGDPRCRIAIFMGKTDPRASRHAQQSMVLVPMDTPGIVVERMLSVFGYDDAPHGHAEMTFTNVRVPKTNLLLGEGRGFEIAQGRLGPGRVHHCMRLIGMAERALEAMCRRVKSRVAFGRPLAEQGTIRADIAESRMAIDQARLLTLQAATLMDTAGNKAARREIAMIKVVVPRMALRVLDRAIQAHGGAGVSGDFELASAWAHARTLRLADGPDEVHRDAIAKLELAKESRNAP